MLTIERVPVNKLVFDPSNARKHPEKNIAAIKGSLSKFGQRRPIVVRGNVVIAGNGTMQAAKELGWTEIDVVRADDMSATEAAAFAIADNRTAELADWDSDVLKDTLVSLKADDFNLSDIGFDTLDFEKLIAPPASGAKELSESEFSEFDHTCPKCGFEFDGK